MFYTCLYSYSIHLFCAHFLIPYLFCQSRFVRREKEIAESRFEVAQGESLRYRLRMEHLERELKEVQDSLSATKERMQVCSILELDLKTFLCRDQGEVKGLELATWSSQLSKVLPDHLNSKLNMVHLTKTQ